MNGFIAVLLLLRAIIILPLALVVIGIIGLACLPVAIAELLRPQKPTHWF